MTQEAPPKHRSHGSDDISDGFFFAGSEKIHPHISLGEHHLSLQQSNLPEELYLISRQLSRPGEYSIQMLLERAQACCRDNNLDWWTILSMLNRSSGRRIAN